MKFYHGSTIQGLSELHPHLPVGAHLQEPRVYLATSRQLALHYIWDSQRLGEVKMPMLDIRDDGTLVFQEMFSGALMYLYKGVSGYIYSCEGDYYSAPVPGASSSIAVSSTVPILECEVIDDVYDHILQYEKQGKLIYEHYEDLPQWRIDLIRCQVLRRIKLYNLLEDTTHSSGGFIQSCFPRYWEEAKVLHAHDLL